MASIHITNKKAKLYLGGTKIKKAYLGSDKVYSAGNIVTYCVDKNVSYQEEVEDGASTLSPASFTPEKSGYTFTGWRTDSTASSNVLSSNIMGDDPITLYAVFQKAVTIKTYNNSATPTTTTEHRYYNNGNESMPSFTIKPNAKNDWDFSGWSVGAKADSPISYRQINNTVIQENTTLYANYSRMVYLYYGFEENDYQGEGKNVYDTGTVSYNSSGDLIKYTFTVKDNMFTKDGYIFEHWCYLNSDNAISPGEKITFDGSVSLKTLVCVWTAATWDKIHEPYMLMDGSPVSDDDPYRRYLRITTENGEKKILWGYEFVPDLWWDGVLGRYGNDGYYKVINAYNEYSEGYHTIYHFDPSCQEAGHELITPSNKMYFVKSSGNGSLSNKIREGGPELEFEANMVGGNAYDVLSFTLYNIPRKGNTKARVYIRTFGGSAWINEKEINHSSFEWVDIPLDTRGDRVTIHFEVNDDNPSEDVTEGFVIKFLELTT